MLSIYRYIVILMKSYETNYDSTDTIIINMRYV